MKTAIKKSVCIFLLMIMIISVSGCGFRNKIKFQEDHTRTENHEITEENTEENSDKLAFEMREEYFESKASDGVLFCSYKISYPYFLGSSEVEKKINTRYEQIINDYKTSSEEDIESWYESIKEYNELHKLPFYNNMEATVSYNQNGYVSLLEWVHDWPGGAHPYHYENGLTYDIQTAQEIDYSGFFTGNAEDIDEFLSKKAIDYDPASYYRYDWYKDSQFVLTDNGICFYFWVGDAVARKEIIIPYSEGKAPFIHVSNDDVPEDLCGITDDLTLENGLLNYYGEKVSVPFCDSDDTIAYYICDLNADSVQELIVKETDKTFNNKYNTEFSSVHYHVYTYTDKVVYLNEIENGDEAKLTHKEDGTGINIHYFLSGGYYGRAIMTLNNNQLVVNTDIPTDYVGTFPYTPAEIPFSSATAKDGYLAIE